MQSVDSILQLWEALWGSPAPGGGACLPWMDEGGWQEVEECSAQCHQKVELHVQTAPHRSCNQQVWNVLFFLFHMRNNWPQIHFKICVQSLSHFNIFGLWHGAPSCWKSHRSPSICLWIVGKLFSWKNSSVSIMWFCRVGTAQVFLL